MAKERSVATLTALRLARNAGLASGETVYLSGGTTAGDGGEGLFQWNAASTATDDGGTIVQATGVTTGRWRRVYAGAVNPKWFGAKGDGSTNDTTAFTNAQGAGEEIRIPPGTYILDQFTLVSNKRWRGVRGQVTLKASGTNDLFVGSGITGVTIYGIKFEGSTSSATAHAGVYLSGGPSFNVISECHFIRWSTAIRLIDNAIYNGIEKCRFEDWRICPESGATVKSAYVHIAQVASLTRPDHCRGNWFRNNTYVGDSVNHRLNADLGPRGFLGITSFSGNVVEGCVFNGWEGNCVVLGGATGDNNAVAADNVVSGNTFTDILTYTSRAIFLFNHCIRNTLTSNTIRSCGGDGIHLTEQCTDNIVSENTIYDCGRATRDAIVTPGSTNPGGIRLDGDFSPNYRNIVSKNVITHCFSMGMSIGNAAHSIVDGNRIYDCGVGDASFGQGVLIGANSTHNSNEIHFVNNEISGCGGYGLHIDGRAQALLLAGNYFSSNGVNSSNTFDGVILKVHDGIYPAGCRFFNNKFSDDAAIGSTTRYAINVDDGVTNIDIRENDLTGVLQPGRVRQGSGASLTLVNNKMDSAALEWAVTAPPLTTTDASLTENFVFIMPSNSAAIVRSTTIAQRSAAGARGTGAVGDSARFVREFTVDMIGANSGTPSLRDEYARDPYVASDLVLGGILISPQVSAGGIFRQRVQGLSNASVKWTTQWEVIPIGAF